MSQAYYDHRYQQKMDRLAAQQLIESDGRKPVRNIKTRHSSLQRRIWHSRMFHRYHFNSKAFWFGFILGIVFWCMGTFDLWPVKLWQFLVGGVLPALILGYFCGFVRDGEEVNQNDN